jgi:hypothetical protein
MTDAIFNDPMHNMCLLIGVFGGLLGSLLMGWLCSPLALLDAKLAVIDRQYLVSALPEPAMKNLGKDLKTFALLHDFILLNGEAVVGGSIPDQTTAFLNWLNQQKQKEPL